MSGRGVLVLGGTGEARELAAALDAEGVPVVSSLAGRVAAPRLPPGAVRIGGFGGAEGLLRWLREHEPAAVVDATHPFATTMAASAATACAQAGVPLLRLERPGWTEGPRDRWHWVDDVAAAADAVTTLGRRVLLTLGGQEVGTFARVTEAWFLVRSIDAPPPPLPPRHELLLDRGPFTLAGELALVDRHGIDVIVTRDSGGPATAGKLEAARERDLPVVVIRRPPRPDGPVVHAVGEAVAWAGKALRTTDPRSRR